MHDPRLLRRRRAADRPRAAGVRRAAVRREASTSSRSAWPGPSGEEGYTTLERRWARPTFDITGLWSGYQGEGAKTVLPATAGAKFSFRLVPNQDPAKITAGLKRRAGRAVPAGHRVGADRPSRRAGRAGAAGQPLHRGGRPGDRARLRPPAGLHPRRRLDSRSSPPSHEQLEGRYAAAGLGPGRRQHPQPQREILAWPISTAASRPARRLWEELSKSMNDE